MALVPAPSPTVVLRGVACHRVGEGHGAGGGVLNGAAWAGPPGSKKQFDVHFGDQKAPIFLIDKESDTAAFSPPPPTPKSCWRCKKRHKEKARDARREHLRYVDESRDVDALLEALSPLDEINTRLEAVEETERGLLADEQEIAALSLLIKQIEGQDQLVVFHAQAVQAVAPLRSPPTLADIAPLDQDVLRLGRAIVSLEVSGARLDSLANLSEPPPLADERALSLLCDGIAKSSSSIRRIGAIRQSLASLSDPPVAMDTQTLTGFLGRLQGAHDALASATGRHAALSDLVESGVVEDPTPLAGLIDHIARARHRRRRAATCDR